jgi:hypothetical protein
MPSVVGRSGCSGERNLDVTLREFYIDRRRAELPIFLRVLKELPTDAVSDDSFRDDIFWAVGYDEEGSKTLLQDYIYAAELRARGMDAKQVHDEVTKKFGKPTYPNPSRAGVSYMLAPVMRGYTHGPTPATMNMPHYMFYAPNVKDKDIGGNSFGQYPFVLSMSPGRDDYIIMLVGETEKAKILLESKNLLAELCSYREYLCTTEATRARTPLN